MSAHKTDAELIELLKQCPPDESVWRHYRGAVYLVLGCAIDERTLQPLVIYERLSDQGIVWSRPLLEWLGTVEVDGRQVRRFVEVV